MTEGADSLPDHKLPVMGDEEEDIPDTEAFAKKRGWVREAADRSMRLNVTIVGLVTLIGCLCGLFMPAGVSRWWRLVCFVPLTATSLFIMRQRGT